MGMAPLQQAGSPIEGGEQREEAARAAFRRLADIAAELPPEAFAGGRPRLSMGMSGDFECAVAQGADVIRVGSALFADVGADVGADGAPPASVPGPPAAAGPAQLDPSSGPGRAGGDP